MENTNPLDGLDELLAGIFEHLKRHERALYDLSVDVEALKSNLTASDRALLEQAKGKARLEAALGFEGLMRLYDEMIRRLRGK